MESSWIGTYGAPAPRIMSLSSARNSFPIEAERCDSWPLLIMQTWAAIARRSRLFAMERIRCQTLKLIDARGGSSTVLVSTLSRSSLIWCGYLADLDGMKDDTSRLLTPR